MGIVMSTRHREPTAARGGRGRRNSRPWQGSTTWRSISSKQVRISSNLMKLVSRMPGNAVPDRRSFATAGPSSALGTGSRGACSPPAVCTAPTRTITSWRPATGRSASRGARCRTYPQGHGSSTSPLAGSARHCTSVPCRLRSAELSLSNTAALLRLAHPFPLRVAARRGGLVEPAFPDTT